MNMKVCLVVQLAVLFMVMPQSSGWWMIKDIVDKVVKPVVCTVSVLCNGHIIRIERTSSSGFPIRSNTNRAVQPQKMAGGVKFRI